MPAHRAFSHCRFYPFSQAVKAAPHVGRGRLCRQPDPLRTIQRPQTRQTNYASVSRAANNACKWLVSNPGSTIRLRPFAQSFLPCVELPFAQPMLPAKYRHVLPALPLIAYQPSPPCPFFCSVRSNLSRLLLPAPQSKMRFT